MTLIGPKWLRQNHARARAARCAEMNGGEISRMEIILKIGYVPQRFDIDRALPMTVRPFFVPGHKTSREALRALLAEVAPNAASISN